MPFLQIGSQVRHAVVNFVADFELFEDEVFSLTSDVQAGLLKISKEDGKKQVEENNLAN